MNSTNVKNKVWSWVYIQWKLFCFLLCEGGIICVTINKDEYIFVFVLEHFESFFESLLTRNTPWIKFSHISFCATHTMLLLFLISTQFSFHFLKFLITIPWWKKCSNHIWTKHFAMSSKLWNHSLKYTFFINWGCNPSFWIILFTPEIGNKKPFGSVFAATPTLFYFFFDSF